MRRIEQFILITLGILLAAGALYVITTVLDTQTKIADRYPLLRYSSGTSSWQLREADTEGSLYGLTADSVHYFQTEADARAVWEFTSSIRLNLNTNSACSILQTPQSPYHVELSKGRISLSVSDSSSVILHAPSGPVQFKPKDNALSFDLNRRDPNHFLLSLHQGSALISRPQAQQPTRLTAPGAYLIDTREDAPKRVTSLPLPSKPQFRFPKNEMGFPLGQLQQGLRLTWDSTQSQYTELQLWRKATNGQLLTDWMSTTQSTWLWHTSNPGDYIWQLRSIDSNAVASAWSDPVTVGIQAQFRNPKLRSGATLDQPAISSKTYESGYLVGGFLQATDGVSLSDMAMVVYAKSDTGAWYIQPRTDHFKIPVFQDGYWETYVHQSDSLALFWTRENRIPDSLASPLSRINILPDSVQSWNHTRRELPIGSGNESD
jgi:hypothetical protein